MSVNVSEDTDDVSVDLKLEMVKEECSKERLLKNVQAITQQQTY